MEFFLGPGREENGDRHMYLPWGSLSLLPESDRQFPLVGKGLFDLDHKLPNLLGAYKIKNDVSVFFPYQFRYFHVYFKILPVQNYTWK